jgi:hypothetical protein
MSAFGAKAEIIRSRCNVRCPSEHDFLDCSGCGDLVQDRSPTSKTLGLTIPASFLSLADELIE